jgi:hypothetical protein
VKNCWQWFLSDRHLLHEYIYLETSAALFIKFGLFASQTLIDNAFFSCNSMFEEEEAV